MRDKNEIWAKVFAVRILIVTFAVAALFLVISSLCFFYLAEWQRGIGCLVGFAVADNLLLKMHRASEKT